MLAYFRSSRVGKRGGVSIREKSCRTAMVAEVKEKVCRGGGGKAIVDQEALVIYFAASVVGGRREKVCCCAGGRWFLKLQVRSEPCRELSNVPAFG